MGGNSRFQPVHLEFIPMEAWGTNCDTYAPVSWEVSFRVLSEQKEELALVRFVSDRKKVRAVVTRDDTQYEREVEVSFQKGYEAIKKLLDDMKFRCIDPWFKKPIQMCYLSCSGCEECVIYSDHKKDCILRKIYGDQISDRFPDVSGREFLPMLESEAYSKAYITYDIPIDIKIKHIDLSRIYGVTLDVQEELRRRFAEDIQKSYPYSPGRDPRSIELYQELQDKGITWSNFLENLDERTDEEITCMMNNTHHNMCRWWIYKDRDKRPEVTDRQRAEEIRDEVVSFYWIGWDQKDVPSRFWKDESEA